MKKKINDKHILVNGLFWWWLKISIVDLATFVLLFYGSWPGNSSSITSLKFTVTQAVEEEGPVDSSASAVPDPEQPEYSVNAITALHAVNEEATVAVLDGTTGDCLVPGPRQPDVSSKPVCMNLLGQHLYSILLSFFF